MAQLNELLVTGASQLLNGLGILGSTTADSILPNITDTYSLGSSEKRWNNLYVKTSNIYQLTVDNLSANTGYFANNLGVGGTNTAYKLYVNGLVKVGNGASATSASTGGLQVNGGIGVSGPSYFNNSITVANNILPEANNTRLLGSSTNYWKEAYISKMYGSADKVDGYHFSEAPYINSASFSQPEADKIWYLKISTGNWNRRSETIYITTAGNNRGGTIILKTGARHSRWFGWATSYNGTGIVGVKKVADGSADDVFIKIDAETTSVTIRTTFAPTIVSTTDTEGYTTVPSSGGFFGNQIQASLEGNADTATILKNARTLKIGKTGKTFNGSANVSWTLAEIGAVAKAGDTMTGFLTLHANPTANLHAATKQYVDASVENAAKLFTTTTTITTDTASSVVFDTSTVTLSTCLIYYNGLLMTPGVNYSITNNTTIALSGWTANKGDIFTVSGKQADETSVIAAGKLNCGTVGSATLPVYFNNGIPVECDTLNYAKLESPNNLLHSTNEFTFAKAGYSGDIYINYRTDGMSTSGNIGEYKFCKGDGAGSLANIRANTFYGALEGNASTATKLATARTISLTGDVTGSASFDGSGNITITTEAGASGVSYVDGSGSTTAGTWIGTNTEISGLYTGLTIAYKIGVAGASTTTLNLTTAAGASGAKTIKRNASNLTTHLPVGTVVLLTYDGTNWCWADYSTADTKNTAGTTNSTSILYLAGATSQAANPQTYSHSAIKANCNSSGANEAGSLTAKKVYGAVWNDYAEYRDQIDVIEPGYCVASTDDGKVYKTIEKFQACDGIVSDTFGFSIGETDNCKTPLAVAGRVLAYCEGDRNSYHAGDTVCASLNGKVMKMTREEIKEYPDRIVGVVSEIPTYESWGSGNVKVNNRIWIKVK